MVRIIGLILFGALFASCGETVSYTAPEIEISKQLADRASDGRVFDLEGLVEGDWESLLILTPYTEPSQKLRSVGVLPPRNFNYSGLNHSDNFVVLVFIKEGKVAASAKVLRYPVDFTAVHAGQKGGIIPRDKATFKVFPRGEENWPDVRFADYEPPVEESTFQIPVRP